jgi:hypothetical protein
METDENKTVRCIELCRRDTELKVTLHTDSCIASLCISTSGLCPEIDPIFAKNSGTNEIKFCFNSPEEMNRYINIGAKIILSIKWNL